MKEAQTTDLNVAEMLAQTFREIGVTHVYGVPGCLLYTSDAADE